MKVITSEKPQKDGLLKWTTAVLDPEGRNLPEYLRALVQFVKSYGIDGTASALLDRPIVKPIAKYPDGSDHLPVDINTGLPVVGLDPDVTKKLLADRWKGYKVTLSNVKEQNKTLFHVICFQSLTKQSQQLLKNCAEWAALDDSQQDWDNLLNLVIKVHTVKLGGEIAESQIDLSIKLGDKIRAFKQPAGMTTGEYIEKFDDLLLQAKTIGLDIKEPELAFVFVNNVRNTAARNKRRAFLTLGTPTPSTYLFAKAFVLQAEAVAASVAGFDGGKQGGVNTAAVTSDVGAEEESALASTDPKKGAGGSKQYTQHSKRDRYQYSKLAREDKEKVNFLEDLARKVRGGEKIDVDVKTIASTVSTLTSATKPSKSCYICGHPMEGPGGHLMRDCKLDPKVVGYKFAPAGFRPRPSFPKEKHPRFKPGDQKKEHSVAVTFEGDEGSEEDFFFLDSICCTDASRPRPASGGHADDDDSDDEIPMMIMVNWWGDLPGDSDRESEESVGMPELIDMSDEDEDASCKVQRSDIQLIYSPEQRVTVELTNAEIELAVMLNERSMSALSVADPLDITDSDEDERSSEGRQVVLVTTKRSDGNQTMAELKSKLEAQISVLTEIVRVPSESEICLQADMIGMPSLAAGVVAAMGSKLIALDNGVMVVKGGPFDVSAGATVILRFNDEKDDTKSENHAAVHHGSSADAKRIEMGMVVATHETGSQRTMPDADKNGIKTGRVIATNDTRAQRLKFDDEVDALEDDNDDELLEESDEYDEGDRCAVKHLKASRVILRAISKKCTLLLGELKSAMESEDLEHERMGKELESQKQMADELRADLDASMKAKPVSVSSRNESSTGRYEESEEMQSLVQSVVDLKRRLRDQSATVISLRAKEIELENVRTELAEASSMIDRYEIAQKSERRMMAMLREQSKQMQDRYEEKLAMMEESHREAMTELGKHRAAAEANKQEVRQPKHQLDQLRHEDTGSIPPPKRLTLPRSKKKISEVIEGEERQQEEDTESANSAGDSLHLDQSEDTVDALRKVLVTDSRTDDVEDEKAAKKRKKVERELAKLSSSGIEVDNFRMARMERYEAEEKAAEERETEGLRRRILWNCSRSVNARNRYKRSFAKEMAAEKEREFQRVQFSQSNGGVRGYLQFLNSQRAFEERNDIMPLTMEWLEEEVKKVRAREITQGKIKMMVATSEGGVSGEDALVTDAEDVAERMLTIRDPWVVCLDNAATLHVFRDKELLHSLKDIREGGVTIGGLNKSAKGVKCDQKGIFLSINGVHHGSDSIANLLSFAKLKDQGHGIVYRDVADEFDVLLKGTKIMLTFKRSHDVDGMHYVCRSSPSEHSREVALIQTVKERQKGHTKAQVREAAKAREQMMTLNFMTPVAHKDIIRNEFIVNNPVSTEALDRSVEIWGRPPERYKGNAKHRKPEAASRRLSVENPIAEFRTNIAHTDLFFVQGVCFMLIVLDPMKYCWVQFLANRATETLQVALEAFYSEMKSRKIAISLLRCDGEGGIWALESWIKSKGTLMDKVAPGAHCEVAERKIEQGKEGVRRACASLPYMLCRMLLVACVLYVFKGINLQRTTGQMQRREAPPQNQFTGEKLDAKLHFQYPFGTYVEATVRDPDNSNQTRSEAAIYCGSTYQATVNNSIYVIKTRKMAERGDMGALPMGQAMIEVLDRQAVRDFGEHASKEPVFKDREERSYERRTAEANHEGEAGTEVEDTAEETGVLEEIGVSGKTEVHERSMRLTRSMVAGAGGIDEYLIDRAAEEASGGREPLAPIEALSPVRDHEQKKTPYNSASLWRRHGPALSPGYFHEWQEVRQELEMNDSPERMTYEDTKAENDLTDVSNESQSSEPRTPSGDEKEWHAQEHALVMSQKQAIRKLGADVALSAIGKELRQMVDKGVWVPVRWTDLSAMQSKKMIRSSMFLKEKHLPNGDFEKLKARFVAGGDGQDKNDYGDLSSPTARLSSVFAVVAIAAAESRLVEVGDIPGAYLNADMKQEVHLLLDRVTSEEMCKIDERYRGFMNDRGCVAVRLLKALYGCVESAKLWNDDIAKTLTDDGFVPNPQDPCVYNKGTAKDNDQITVVLYVDDLLVTCVSRKRIDELWKLLRMKYAKPPQPDISVKAGPVISYLGMTFDFRVEGEVAMTQCGFVNDLVKDSGIDENKKAATPAADNLFEVRDDTEAGEATAAQIEWYHSFTAKCLYLAKRSRPEILTAVAFLATRITKCNMDDLKKLARLLYYISSTRERGIVFRPGVRGMQVRQFIDAAYGVHTDMKSTSGGVTVIGDAGPNMTSSCKQSIVTKSSTEAELVAASDLMNQPFHVRQLLIEQGYDQGPVTLYQDNLNCMHLIAKGRAGSQKTRHISIRYYWIKQYVDDGQVVVEKLATEEMPANLLTKPLQGSQFRYERKLLTNWKD